MNCCCCSGDQTEGSGSVLPRPAALKEDVDAAAGMLAARVLPDWGVAAAGGVGISEVSPTKSVRPTRPGRGAAEGQREVYVGNRRGSWTYGRACTTHRPRRGQRW